MILAALAAQWADLATYLLAVQLHPHGESWVLAGLLPEQVAIVKGTGICVALLVSSRMTHFRGVVPKVAIALGLVGSLTNLVGGLW